MNLTSATVLLGQVLIGEETTKYNHTSQALSKHATN